jgi:putative transposase
MVMKEHEEHQKAKHRAVYNDWGLYQFVQMLEYKCAFAGKALEYIDEHDSSKRCSRCGHKQPMPLYKRTYRCQNCGLVMDRDGNSASNHYQRFFARLGPHTGDPVRCAAVFTAIDTFAHV